MSENDVAAGEFGKVGGYIFARIGALTAASPAVGTSDAAELDYLMKIAVGVDFYPEKAAAGEALAPFQRRVP